MRTSNTPHHRAPTRRQHSGDAQSRAGRAHFVPTCLPLSQGVCLHCFGCVIGMSRGVKRTCLCWSQRAGQFCGHEGELCHMSGATQHSWRKRQAATAATYMRGCRWSRCGVCTTSCILRGRLRRPILALMPLQGSSTHVGPPSVKALRETGVRRGADRVSARARAVAHR